MNSTERAIVGQFPYLAKAPAPIPLVGEGPYVIVGCGTSFHLAQSIAASFNLAGLTALAVPGGEWSRRRTAYLPEGVAPHVIALSRSGESTETVQAVQISRHAGFETTVLTCEPGSSITRQGGVVIVAETHPDECIVMTSSASLMLMLGLRLAGIPIGAEEIEAAQAALRAADPLLPPALAGRSHFVYLGAGPLYGIAAEGSIKVQEMSLSYAQAYHTMEYRHGPISLVDDRTFAVLLYNDATRDEEARLAREIADKGGRVLGIGGPGDLAIDVGGSSAARALVALPMLQLLGERVAGLKGLDTTAPRHLSKVVVLA